MRRGLVVVLLLFLVASCSGDDGDRKVSVSSTTTTAGVTTSAAEGPSSSVITATTAVPGTTTDASSDDPGLAPKAASVTRLVTEERWADVRAEFNERMRQQLSEEDLANAWQAIKSQGGSLLEIGTTVYVATDGANAVYDTPLRFERGNFKCRASFDADSKVSGLFILRA